MCWWYDLHRQHVIVSTKATSTSHDLSRAGRPLVRNLVGARFSAPVHTGPWARPTCYSMGTGSFPGGKTAGAWRWAPAPSSVKVKERVDLCLYAPSGSSRPVVGWILPYIHLASSRMTIDIMGQSVKQHEMFQQPVFLETGVFKFPGWIYNYYKMRNL